MRHLRALFPAWLLAIALLASPHPAAAVDPVIHTVAIVPQFKAQQLQQEWKPLLDRIGAETGLRFELRFYPGIPEFEKAFLAGEPDFAFMNPYHAVMAHRAQGYIPLVSDKKPLSGILVVAAQNPITQIKELNGKKVAFPSPNAFGASLYMRALLQEKEKIRIEPSYVKTHANVYRQVLLGDVAAGGGVNQTFADESPEIRARLRILYETPNAAPHPMTVHPRVPEKSRRDFMRAFLRLAEDEAGKALLKEARIPNPIPVNYERDYRPLEKLGLEKFVILE